MPYFIAVVLLALGTGIMGFSIGADIMQDYYQEEAVSREYAEYCPTTGDWAWKGECSK